MSTRFSWLLLSDLHAGVWDQASWSIYAEAFLRDLAQLHEKTGPWDAILFTGDLTFSGQRDQYSQVTTIISMIENVVKLKQNLPPLLIVPGNHEVQRPDSKKPTPAAIRCLTQLWGVDEKLPQDFWNSPDNEYITMVRNLFNNYSTWEASINRILPANYRRGVLPGDFQVSIEKDGVRLGIHGLNSSFLHIFDPPRTQASDDTEPRLRLQLGIKQLTSLCGEYPHEYFNSFEANFLMTHHPPEWIDGYERHIAPVDRFHLHLFGHMHNPRRRTETLAGQSRHTFQSCSLFGEKSRWKDRPVGYSVGELIVRGNGRGDLAYWPRRAEVAQYGAIRFIAEPSDDTYGSGKTRPEPIKLRAPKKQKMGLGVEQDRIKAKVPEKYNRHYVQRHTAQEGNLIEKYLDEQQSPLFVVGESGCGKSSFVDYILLAWQQRNQSLTASRVDFHIHIPTKEKDSSLTELYSEFVSQLDKATAFQGRLYSDWAADSIMIRTKTEAALERVLRERCPGIMFLVLDHCENLLGVFKYEAFLGQLRGRLCDHRDPWSKLRVILQSQISLNQFNAEGSALNELCKVVDILPMSDNEALELAVTLEPTIEQERILTLNETCGGNPRRLISAIRGVMSSSR